MSGCYSSYSVSVSLFAVPEFTECCHKVCVCPEKGSLRISSGTVTVCCLYLSRMCHDIDDKGGMQWCWFFQTFFQRNPIGNRARRRRRGSIVNRPSVKLWLL